jgi:hypothetical protein
MAAMTLLSTVGADAPLWRTDIYMALFGIGLGLQMQTIQLSMQNAVEPGDIGVASSSGTFFRQLGGTLGAAVFLSILFSVAPGKIGSAFGRAESTSAYKAAAAAHPDQVAALGRASGSLNDTAFLSSIDPVLAHPFLIGFSQAMDVVFIIGAIVVIPALIFALLVKEVPLRRVSGIAARAAAAEQAAAGQAAAGQAASEQRDSGSVGSEPTATEPIVVDQAGEPAASAGRDRSAAG